MVFPLWCCEITAKYSWASTVDIPVLLGIGKTRMKNPWVCPRAAKTTPDTITQLELTRSYELMGEVLTILGHIGGSPIKHDKLTGRIS